MLVMEETWIWCVEILVESRAGDSHDGCPGLMDRLWFRTLKLSWASVIRAQAGLGSHLQRL